MWKREKDKNQELTEEFVDEISVVCTRAYIKKEGVCNNMVFERKNDCDLTINVKGNEEEIKLIKEKLGTRFIGEFEK